jgi:hypothetical protein
MKDMLLTYRYPFMALAVAAAAIALSATPGLSLDPGSSIYVRTDMVSDNTASVPAAVQDKRLLNSWGIVFSPMAPFWINHNNAGLSTLYSFDSKTGLVSPLLAEVARVDLLPQVTISRCDDSDIDYRATSR